MDQSDKLPELLAVIDDIAAGHYSNDIMGLTGPEVPEPIRSIAESMGLMMVRVEAREFHLEQLNQTIKDNALKTVTTMAHALGARDSYTEGHTARVAELAHAVARRMGLGREECEYVRLAGVLHDVGKIGFPDALFDDHAQKNPPELVKQITRHPEIGARILSDLDFLGPAIEYVRCHHERIDGSGYPRGLKDGDVPLGAQILAAADVYDAVATDRPYQKGKSPREVLAILAKQAGKRIGREVVEALSQEIEERLARAENEDPPLEG